VSVLTLRRWTAERRVKAFRPGRKLLYSRADLDEAVRAAAV
jgi:excisionase family DNA binding protein